MMFIVTLLWRERIIDKSYMKRFYAPASPRRYAHEFCSIPSLPLCIFIYRVTGNALLQGSHLPGVNLCYASISYFYCTGSHHFNIVFLFYFAKTDSSEKLWKLSFWEPTCLGKNIVWKETQYLECIPWLKAPH